MPPEPATPDLSVGEVIEGLYEIRALLGEGGMGKVHRAYHREWGVELAIKSPRPELLAERGGRDAFVAEAETWVGLDPHPNVVACHYVRTLRGLPRVVAEYVDGGSLHDLVQSGALYAGGVASALPRLLDLAIQSAWGLDHAHRAGLVHQDVKPHNILVTRNGVAKVTDFGLARSVRRKEGTRSDVTVGGMTVAYCSPEQAAGARLTQATDVWSWAL